MEHKGNAPVVGGLCQTLIDGLEDLAVGLGREERRGLGAGVIQNIPQVGLIHIDVSGVVRLQEVDHVVQHIQNFVGIGGQRHQAALKAHQRHKLLEGHDAGAGFDGRLGTVNAEHLQTIVVKLFPVHLIRLGGIGILDHIPPVINVREVNDPGVGHGGLCGAFCAAVDNAPHILAAIDKMGFAEDGGVQHGICCLAQIGLTHHGIVGHILRMAAAYNPHKVFLRGDLCHMISSFFDLWGVFF